MIIARTWRITRSRKLGVWKPWPIGEWTVTAAFKFPVPKNEFVDLVLRANDLPIDDAHAIYRDEVARRALFEMDVLPTAPGALAISTKAITITTFTIQSGLS